jgi:hypothetical protein
MNKFLSVFVALAMMSGPAMAHDRWEDNRRGRLSTSDVITLGVGVAVLGAVLSERNRQRDHDRRLPHTIDPWGRVDPYDIYRPRCIREQVVWRDAFGRLHRTFEYRCNR